MPKKTPVTILIDEAGTKLMSACLQLEDPLTATPASTELRSAIYHLTKAKLWLFCPEAMQEAERGALGRMEAKVLDRLAQPPAPKNHAPPSPPLK